MGEPFDLKQTAVGPKADLPQLREILEPLADAEVPWIILSWSPWRSARPSLWYCLARSFHVFLAPVGGKLMRRDILDLDDVVDRGEVPEGQPTIGGHELLTSVDPLSNFADMHTLFGPQPLPRGPAWGLALDLPKELSRQRIAIAYGTADRHAGRACESLNSAAAADAGSAHGPSADGAGSGSPSRRLVQDLRGQLRTQDQAARHGARPVDRKRPAGHLGLSRNRL